MAKPAKKRLCDENSIYCCGTDVITKLYRAWDVRNNVGKVNDANGASGTQAAKTSSKSDHASK